MSYYEIQHRKKEKDSEEFWRTKTIAHIKGKWHKDCVAKALEELKQEKLLEDSPDTLLGRTEEIRLLENFRSSPNCEGKYLVVLGETGVGKTALVRTAFHDKEGVIYVPIHSDLAPMDVRYAFFAALDYPVDKFPRNNSWRFLSSLCLAAKIKIDEGKKGEREIPPLLLIEVNDRGPKDDLVRILCSEVKHLVADKRAARAVIVLNDTLATDKLTSDPYRRNVLWLKDLSTADADVYLDKMNFAKKVEASLIPEEEKCKFVLNPSAYIAKCKREIFEKVGTQPSTLKSLMHSNLTIQDFIEKRVTEAADRIDRSVLTDRRWVEIYRKLLSKMPPNDFLTWDDFPEDNLTPEEIFDGVNKYHVLSFDPNKNTFSFQSPALRTAAARVCLP